MNKKGCAGILLCLALGFGSAVVAYAQEIVPDTITIEKGKVTAILSQEMRDVPGTETPTVVQSIRVLVSEGEDAGKEVEINNDYAAVRLGDKVYLTHVTNPLDGRDEYVVSDISRLPTLAVLVLLFVLCAAFFGGKQGIRGLLALLGSLLVILFIMLPAILAGYSALPVSISIASLIIILGSYITHGFNRTTTSAVFGMIVTILFTGLLAFVSVASARLSGINDEDAVYLNFNTAGAIDLPGLLLGGILIGLLGVLYDVAIGQAVAVEELATAAPGLSRRELYLRGIRIGREHIGALVNMLAIAYVGSSLTLILLYSTSEASWIFMVNREVFATEIIRIMVGSIGVILAVPITTALAVLRTPLSPSASSV